MFYVKHNNTEYKVVFTHCYDNDEYDLETENRPPQDPTRRVTICRIQKIITETSEYSETAVFKRYEDVATGFAWCNKSDQFCKSKGRKIALADALNIAGCLLDKAGQEMITLAGISPINVMKWRRSAFWNAYEEANGGKW